jgi:hypothetical protein
MLVPVGGATGRCRAAADLSSFGFPMLAYCKYAREIRPAPSLEVIAIP